MGVPKFFRYISERYPCLSEVVREYQLPEFDNLYLDMNGIIHVCSHPNDNDPHFRITEEKIFRDIFHYIETLFRMIQPQKLFFMAVDGVAPRAKMNQQRGRRFRSAKEVEMAEEKAKLRGEELPSAERFDSNCITPGTEFMTRLQAQLKYFVTFKVSTDKLWQKTKVILSGHETPGEGEHKIMDYIRFMKSQPDYDPNTRHCLYGLDADLIMLGLCTHEPHFALLREEVKYGKKNNQKRIPTPEETTFFLLHLSLMREYLDLEFQELKTTVPFRYDLESIIDDWVLMGFLVGNDFIPHLPDLHINKGALPILYKTYIDVLPTLGGYINEGGELKLDRFQKYMEKLAAFDLDQFKETTADLKYFESKTGRRPGAKERHSYKADDEPPSPPKNKDLAALIASTAEMLLDDEVEDDDDENYTDIDSDEDDTSMAEFNAMKKNYYKEKMEYEKVTQDVMRSQSEGYVRAIQWNLNYYYNGCSSWSWFYPHHYAPYISDIKGFSDLKLEYDLAQPFLPFQQLLAVLPSASKKLLPSAYHELMEDEKSPIINFYPTDFKTDLNGKKQDWEAVVLIPFIEQGALLSAMESKAHLLTDEEKSRNKHGPMQVYTYTAENLGSYLAPAYFPALANHHAREENVTREQLFMKREDLIKGLCPGVLLDVYFPGFPTLRHIPFTAALEEAKVKVFESPSRENNMMLTLKESDQPEDLTKVANELLGKSIFVNWPHLFEARGVCVSNGEKRLTWRSEDNTIVSEDMTKALQDQWSLSEKGIKERYRDRLGINIGKTDILVYACTLEDKKLVLKDGELECQKQWSRYPTAYAYQTIKANIEVHVPVENLATTLDQLFIKDSVVFSLYPPYYGVKGNVVEITEDQQVKVKFEVETEPNIDKQRLRRMAPPYFSGSSIASRLGLSSHLLSRITGTIYVISGDIQQEAETKSFKLNIGLNLKFNKRNEEVSGFTRRDKNNYWLYSHKVEEEIREYKEMFPEIFTFLQSQSGAENVHATDLYPEDTVNKIKKLGDWLKERNSNKAERQVCGAQILEEESVTLLEALIDLYLKNEKKTNTVIQQVKPHTLYIPKPKLGQSPDPRVLHQLFDRVVSIRDSHTVPLGAKGTIIGIHDEDKGPEACYDVLFDKEFPGGLKMRCSPNRGYRLPGQALINISYGLASDKKAQQFAAQSNTNPVAENDVQNNHKHNSAFASWRKNSDQDGVLAYENDQKGKAKIQNHHGKMKKPANPQNEGSQQVSKEFLSMLKNLKPSGPTQKSTAVYTTKVDQSLALKKMLKIADPPNKNVHLGPENGLVFKQPGENSKPENPDSVYSMELLSLHQKRGLPPPKYTYMNRGNKVVCVAICGTESYEGEADYPKERAAENAAKVALREIRARMGQHEVENVNVNHNVPPMFQAQRLPQRQGPQMHNMTLRSQYNPPNRSMEPQNMSWNRGPTKPTALPQPPTNWYLNNSGGDWRSGKGHNPQFYPQPHMPQHQPQYGGPPNFHPRLQMFFNQEPPQMQPRAPFVPLQADARKRMTQQQHNQYPQHPPAKPSNPHHTNMTNQAGNSTPSKAATAKSSSRQPRSRLAANFNNPFSFSPK